MELETFSFDFGKEEVLVRGFTCACVCLEKWNLDERLCSVVEV